MIRLIKSLFIILAVGVLVIPSHASFTITAPSSIEADFNVPESTLVQITSDQAESLRRIRLIGMTSSDSQNCVKEFALNETCSFTIQKTVVAKSSGRIYLYPRSSSRVIQTIVYDVKTDSTRDDLTSGIEFIHNNQTISSLDLGSIVLEATTGARIYVKNSGNQKTSAIEPLSSTYSGSSSFSVVRDTCGNKELEPNRRCYFDIRFFPVNGIDGANTGDFTVKSSSGPGTTLSVLVNLTVPGNTNQNISEVNYFCTQTGITESGFSSPPFCSSAGTAVDTQYISFCFTNPSWCSLNPDSEDSVRAATDNDLLSIRLYAYTEREPQDFIINALQVVFLKVQDLVSVSDYVPTYTGVVVAADVSFNNGTATDAAISSALSGQGLRYSSSKSASLSNLDVIEDEGLTDAQLYSKYQDEIEACFAAGGDGVRFTYRKSIPTAAIANYPGPSSYIIDFGDLTCDISSTIGGVGTAVASHGYSIVSNQNTGSVFEINYSTYTTLEDYSNIFSMPILNDFGNTLTENYPLKKLEIQSVIDNN